MNDLCVEIGYNSINHVGEELCGDHVEAVGQGEDSSVLVLADGLGSGVKANILSILTSRIISTMIAEGLPLDNQVSRTTRYAADQNGGHRLLSTL